MKKMTAFLMLVFVCLAVLPLPGQAKIYYIKKGVKYHIGDNKYGRSEDSLFLGTYPVVGPTWVQYFKVDRKDRVKVHIDHIWGVDDCDYCKIIISVDDWDMGRLYGENNHKAFDTPTELAKDVEPGHVYKLQIASLGRDDVDDFVIEDVSVESDADVTFISEPQIGTCDKIRPTSRWLINGDDGRPAKFTLSSATADFAASSVVARVAGGAAVEFGFKVNQVPVETDLVSQPLEILVGDESRSGWILSFTPGRDEMAHGNMMYRGLYRQAKFAPNYVPGLWNKIRIAHCNDGTVRLFMNNVEMSQDISVPDVEAPVYIRVMGLDADFSQTPE